YFSEPDPYDSWIPNPFSCVEIDKIRGLSENEQDQLVDLSNCGAMKSAFDVERIADFWLVARKVYPKLGEKALKHLLPFITTYKCEQAISTMCFLKNKHRNRLDMRFDFRVKVSSI